MAGPTPEQTLRLPPHAASVPTARALVRRCLSGWSADTVDAAELCMSELVTNAVVHARTDFEASVQILLDRARLQIRDYSPALPRQVVHSTRSATGRGLDLVRVLAAEWGAELLAGEGKVVWCELTSQPQAVELDEDALLDAWGDDLGLPAATLAPPSARVGRLLGYPVQLGMQYREHFDALLRECVLVDDAAARRQTGAPRRLVELAHALTSRYSAVATAADRARLAALRRGEATVDLEYVMSDETPEIMAALRAALAALDQYAGQNALLTLRTPAQLRRLNDWVLDELAAQARGAPPNRWDGPLE